VPASICFSGPNDVLAPVPAEAEPGTEPPAGDEQPATETTDADATAAAKPREKALLLSTSYPRNQP
jgi:hypothetical protein